jgi:hypothetical protein
MCVGSGRDISISMGKRHRYWQFIRSSSWKSIVARKLVTIDVVTRTCTCMFIRGWTTNLLNRKRCLMDGSNEKKRLEHIHWNDSVELNTETNTMITIDSVRGKDWRRIPLRFIRCSSSMDFNLMKSLYFNSGQNTDRHSLVAHRS